MRKDTGIDGDAQRISQMGWMLFLKIYDDSEHERELLDKDYKSLVPDHLKWRNWASDDEGITGDELVEFVNNDLFPTLKDLSAPADSKARGLSVREVFADMFNYMKSGQLLRQVIKRLTRSISTTSSNANTLATSTRKSSTTSRARAMPANTTPPAPSPSLWSIWWTPNWAKP